MVEARAELVRRGRTTMVIEALVVNVREDGTEVLDGHGASAPVAWSTLTFAVLPGGNRNATETLPFDLPTKLEIDGSGLDRPLVETLGMTVRVECRRPGSLPVHPYFHNSIGAVQGGAMALLGDVAAAEALAAAVGLRRAAMVVTDLQVAYLTLGRMGPIVTRATVLDTAPGQGAAVLRSRSSRQRGGGAGGLGAGRPADHGGQRPGDGRRQHFGVVQSPPAGPDPSVPRSVGHGGRERRRPTGPVDARHYMSEYFRLERWEIPPPDGDGQFSEFAGRMPLDDHHRGSGGGMRTGALLTNIDSVGGFLAGLSVLPRWIVTTSLMVHGDPARPPGTASGPRAGPPPRAELRGGRPGRGRRGAGRRIGGGLDRHLLRPRPGGDERRASSDRQSCPCHRPPSMHPPRGVLPDRAGAGTITRLELADHLRNPWGILHGGAVAVLADVAACRAAAGVDQAGGPPGAAPGSASAAAGLAAADTVLHFLRPVRMGPVEARCRVLGGPPGRTLVRVAVHDVGPTTGWSLGLGGGAGRLSRLGPCPMARHRRARTREAGRPDPGTGLT